MQPFKGKLLKDGQVIADSVTGRLDVDPGPTAASNWTGFFSVSEQAQLAVGDICDLLLDDGRSNRIRVERVNVASFGVAVSFLTAK